MFESSSTLYLGEEGAYPIPTIEFKNEKRRYQVNMRLI
jgi:hypothetical protein